MTNITQLATALRAVDQTDKLIDALKGYRHLQSLRADVLEGLLVVGVQGSLREGIEQARREAARLAAELLEAGQ